MFPVFSGHLISGHGRGKKLEVPTLNLDRIKGDKPQDFGVYAVYASWQRKTYQGVMHIGPRPTFNELDVSIEVHLLDYEKKSQDDSKLIEKADLVVKITIIEKLRSIKKFNNPEALKKQMRKDMISARLSLKKHPCSLI
ncbi:MAG: FMN adenylyltransferase,riboflavin kinase, riboflavin kinase / FMN adenylyltransferase [Candidatus Peregrinibacteria bacterium GW2011_GWE2_39_6]|nr:MAG: FMN adenylyltransferase,riboflavin kinase, riboflavin kinase / FMN adenylyltransferase [Candidatus Peregrinibacteria bacterium GW2011_GWF2_39_17]KKR24732.1 MAG: FMN adenylyltransferase,riboflavin kinase, riboflavin kinase / FMN adenylyltransferase [Candidatus Peregrinibacteria bacterium GW2011_GWE2_39_6]HCW32246.1 hypothetical protein [Candidatus Peregrinibacteria bacterium]